MSEREELLDEVAELRARKQVLQASIAELRELMDALEQLQIAD